MFKGLVNDIRSGSADSKVFYVLRDASYVSKIVATFKSIPSVIVLFTCGPSLGSGVVTEAVVLDDYNKALQVKWLNIS
jgi:hypothetical protein